MNGILNVYIFNTNILHNISYKYYPSCIDYFDDISKELYRYIAKL